MSEPSLLWGVRPRKPGAVTSVALIDDHPVFRESLKVLLETRGDISVVGETSFAECAFDVIAATKPDVVLLDVVFAAGRSGISVARELLQQNPSQRVVFVTMMKDPANIAEALRAGALGYVTKDQQFSELMHALTEVLAGRQYVGTSIQAADLKAGAAHPLASLTVREREVFDLVVAGLSSQSVAERLRISARTIETHRGRIMAKLGVKSVVDLTRIAARMGLLN